MKVKMLVSRAGIDGAVNAGEIIEVEKDEALRMIKAGQCIAADNSKIERAILKSGHEKRD